MRKWERHRRFTTVYNVYSGRRPKSATSDELRNLYYIPALDSLHVTTPFE